MANRDTRFLIKRSNVPGKIPTNGDLLLGELGLNTADAILYTSGTTANSILPIGWDRVARTGDTMTGGLFTPYLSATTVSATTYLNLPTFTGDYLPLSGGTVYGPTIYSSGLTANTLNVTGLTQTSGITSTGGIIFPQKTLTTNYTATTADYFLNITGDTLDVTLMSTIGIQGKILVVKNEGSGIVNVISQLGELIDDRTDVLLTQGNSVQLISDGINWVIIGYNISSTQANTGVISFSGLSKVSSSTFNVGPVQGYIVDDTTNPTIPFLTFVNYSGGVHTDNYVNTDYETFVYITSGGTIGQQPTPLTAQQRRQNILLGKLGHPDKTVINLVFSQPDYVLTPLGQLRDMFIPINLINGGVYPSANTGLTMNTTSGNIYGLGINFTSNKLNPNSLYISGQTPCTFQYRTQTGGSITNTTTIDVLNYDLNGVITALSGTKATNQRIYLLQNGTFRVQYGQHVYANFAEAIQNLQTEDFTIFPNFINNAVLIGVLTVLSSATDLTDTSKARFFFASKFGETVGATGGVSTTTLQQAYNNSSNPEITINSTLDGLSIKNGTGNADNVTKLLEGLDTSGNTTSFIRADGYISGTTLQTGGFIANSDGLTATTVSATTYLNLPIDVYTTGGTYSSGSATFTNNTGGTFNVSGFNTGDTTLYWYSENATPPLVTPIATGTGSIALGDNAQALSSDMFVYGSNAGYSNINSSGSTFIGNNSGNVATGSEYSNFIGFNAGSGSTNSDRSNFIGQNAGREANDSSYSNFHGYLTGYLASGSSNSNFIGVRSGQEAFNTTYSNFQGYFAGRNANDTIYSNFIGSSAGYGASGTTGSTFIGYAAGYLNTGSSYSNFIGYNAGNNSDNSIYSNFIGRDSGYLSSGNTYSNFIGLDAGKSSSGNIYGNFIGRGAGLSATTSNNSSFIGLYAGRSSNSLTYSNAIGNNAGYEASGSTFTNFIGGDAGYQSSGNSYSNFIGYQAGYKGINNSYGAFFGSGSGYQSSGNTYGVFIGTNPGLSSSGNIQSNFIGASAGREVTGATNSNFIGTNAGQGVLGSISANFLGYQVGYQSSGNSYSNFIGYVAGYQSSGNSYSNFIGYQAGRTSITSNNSNFIGNNAGYLSSGGPDSNFIGVNAGLQSNNNSSTNFIGNSAGWLSQDNLNGTFIGTNAGRNASGSTYTNFIGYQSGYNSTGNTYSNFIGGNAGYSASTSVYSNFIGGFAGYLVTGASYSNFMGQYAGNGATNVTHNNFFGTRAGEQSIGTMQSNFIGYLAGQYASNADYSNFIGTGAGYSASTSNYSNFIGVNAGRNATGVTYSNFIGVGAGSGATTVSYSNLFGFQSGKRFTGNNIGSNNIIIGTNISLPNASANGINIGGVLFGVNTYSTTTGDPSIVARSTGKIGINVVTPTEALHVSGNTLINGNLTATTISATTYQNLPTDIRVTGASYSNNTFTYTNNTGGTFNTLFNTVTGLTVNGNLSVTGNTSMTGTLSVTGNTNVRAITGTSATISGSGSSILTVIGSGTTTPIFSVQGSSGELFSVTDSLTGSLFSVNDISGLPIVEVFSDNTILMGNYLAPSLNTTAKISLTAGTNTIYSIPTSAYTGAFIDYTVINSVNTSARAGNIMTIWNTGSTQYTEVSTNDIGSTTGITFSTSLSGSNALISASATTAGWTLKTIIRAI